MIPRGDNSDLRGQEESSNVSRRTVVKGAAWAVPVVATGIHVPALAATGSWDVSITGTCSGNYDFSALESLIPDGEQNAHLVLEQLEILMRSMGYLPNPRRYFTISAADGVVPAGTQFLIRDPDAILTLTFLQGLLDLGLDVWFALSADPQGYLFALQKDFTVADEPIEIDLTERLIAANILTTTYMSLVGSDRPADPSDEVGPDTAIIRVLASTSETIVFPPWVNNGILAVQLCGAL